MKKTSTKIIVGILAAIVQIFNMVPFLLFGSALCLFGHDYSEPTCTAPATCSRCDKEKGEPLPHDYLDATCTAPKTCKDCGATVGDALEHTPGDEIIEYTSYTTASYTVATYCTVCNARINDDFVEMDSLHDGKNYLFNAEEFNDRYSYILDTISGCDLYSDCETVGAAYISAVKKSGTTVGTIGFFVNGEVMKPAQKSSREINDIMCIYNYSNTSDFAYMTLAFILTCDPSLDFEDAKALAIEVTSESVVTYNGITYTSLLSSLNENVISAEIAQ